MKQMIRYKGGNALSYADYGEEKGYPILTQHGMIASIRDHHLFHALIESGKRVICVARPGYGGSSPYEMKNMAEWGEIISVVADELELSQFDVMGMSSGAPYSYAIGYQLPEKVRSIFIFSGTPALYDEKIVAHWPYPIQKDASIPALQQVAHQIFFSSVTKEDLERNDIRDSMRNDCFGIAQDLKLRCVDWGFKLSDIKAPVSMEHSQTDRDVPLITAQMTAQLLPHCQFEIREGEHFSEDTLKRFIRNRLLRQ